MAVRTRTRAILTPIVFYLVLGAMSAWLVWGASQGERGLKAKENDDVVAAALRVELASLVTEHERLRRRVESMRSEAVDRDLLDEEAHAKLDRVGKDEAVIFTDVARTDMAKTDMAKTDVVKPN